MKKQEWQLKYINRFIERGLTAENGKAIYDAGVSDHNFDEDPVDMANDELSYWIGDA